MLTFPHSVRIFLACGATDMRKSYDGLSAAVRDVIGLDPLSGHLFCFTNRARNRLKILYWDRSGFWLFCKRLEMGSFSWPSKGDRNGAKVELDYAKLALLLGGLDVATIKRRRWFDLAPGSDVSKRVFQKEK